MYSIYYVNSTKANLCLGIRVSLRALSPRLLCVAATLQVLYLKAARLHARPKA